MGRSWTQTEQLRLTQRPPTSRPRPHHPSHCTESATESQRFQHLLPTQVDTLSSNHYRPPPLSKSTFPFGLADHQSVGVQVQKTRRHPLLESPMPRVLAGTEGPRSESRAGVSLFSWCFVPCTATIPDDSFRLSWEQPLCTVGFTPSPLHCPSH